MKFVKFLFPCFVFCIFTILNSCIAEYSSELQEAYSYAYKNGITTMNTIEKANIDWNLTRIAMAKMMANYAINVLWLSSFSDSSCNFDDVSASLNSDYWNGVTNACKLWIMWQNMWSKFRPNDTVTRAEFGTALSRTLHKALWTTLSDWSPYYTTHLNYLNTNKIMNNISNPDMLEQRWYVMLMMMRSADIVWDAGIDAWDCVAECFELPESGEFDATEIFNCLQSCVK
jgi:hypothetical protein